MRRTRAAMRVLVTSLFPWMARMYGAQRYAHRFDEAKTRSLWFDR
jgi:hypothetical protein